MWLFVAFLAVPLIEIGLFVELGGAIGLWATLAWVLLSAVLGVLILRLQGLRGVEHLRGGLRGIDPLSPLIHRVLKMLAGVLLILPGFFTDTLGLLLLIEPVRRLLITVLTRRVTARVRTEVRARAAGFAAAREPHRPDPGYIDAEFQDVTAEEAEQPPTRGRSGWTRP